MKLRYRGVAYEPNLARPESREQPVSREIFARSPYTLTYRGAKYLVDPEVPSASALASMSGYSLSYRGVSYQPNSDAQESGSTTETASQAHDQPITVPSIFPRHQYVGKVHQANLLKNVQRRLKAAQARKDEKLIALLKAEQQQISTGNTSYSS